MKNRIKNNELRIKNKAKQTTLLFFRILYSKFRIPNSRFQLRAGFTPTPIFIGVGSQSERGFTLVELLVVFFIMASILAVVIPGYLEYSTKLELQNLALDVALTIREAQSYGAGAKITSGGSFTTGYGIHFDKSDPTHFIFFENTADGSNNYNRYTDDATYGHDNIISKYTMKTGYSIYSLCDANDLTKCNSDTTSLGSFDVIFNRPSPEAIIKTGLGATAFGASPSQGIAAGEVVFISPDQTRASVTVESAGNISIGQ